MILQAHTEGYNIYWRHPLFPAHYHTQSRQVERHSAVFFERLNSMPDYLFQVKHLVLPAPQDSAYLLICCSYDSLSSSLPRAMQPQIFR